MHELFDRRNPISKTFRLMEIAEEEIAAAGDPEGAFEILCPPPSLRDLREDLYRAHARELLRRHCAGASRKAMEMGTLAEICALLHQLSLKAPLKRDYARVFEFCFRECMPEEAGELFENPVELDIWEREELLPELRRKACSRRGFGS